ncbi:MAG: 3',5'-cyclic-nucleotide phosphodiesterase [Rhodocyclales bacterium GT-UBC]|nr:MAG: 3',5'-cyclic-nucleotide phosphodiesterase [Rhodocyclales bacterium GT-UBC]
MKLRVLGCSGGIGSSLLRTTSLRVDDDILIDAGTGVADMDAAELAAIDHVFLTHAHLDHIAALPLMVEAIADRRSHPVMIYAVSEVIEALKKHVFNWTIWPDFSVLPTPEAPLLRYRSLISGETIKLDQQRSITAIPVNHTVPAVAYHLDSGRGSLVFSGDFAGGEGFWAAVNRIENLKHLIVECAFSNADADLASVSKHLYPDLLVREISQLNRSCDIHITHLKWDQGMATMDEIESRLGHLRPGKLMNNQVIDF